MRWLIEWIGGVFRSWIERLTQLWEIPDQFNDGAWLDDASLWHIGRDGNRLPFNRVLIVVFSIGLNRKGEPTFANAKLIDHAMTLYRRCKQRLMSGGRCLVVFCTGENQPVGISSAVAMKDYALRRFRHYLDSPDDLRVDLKSWDTPSNAAEAATLLEHIPMAPDRHAHVGVILVSHRLHARRSRMCLMAALRRRDYWYRVWSITYRVIVSPADYARHNGRRLYEPTPGQPWLNSHALYLLYEMLAYLPTVLLQGKSKRRPKLIQKPSESG